jgi:serine protease inhibitor
MTKPKEFRVDRPFIFFIYDNLIGVILVLERVDEPNS